MLLDVAKETDAIPAKAMNVDEKVEAVRKESTGAVLYSSSSAVMLNR